VTGGRRTHGHGGWGIKDTRERDNRGPGGNSGVTGGGGWNGP
jgi:hypothetical protein